MKRIKETVIRVLSSFSINEIIGICSIVMMAFFVRALILQIPPLQSDESIYVYAAYAIAKGVVPYREIFLAHPPLMYIIYAMFVQLVDPNFIHIRLFNVGIYLITIILTYIMAKLLLKNHKKGSVFGLLCAAIYAFYPSYFLFISINGPLENILTLFTLSSVIFYILFRNSKKVMLLFLAGVLMGCALMTTYRAVLFIISVVLFDVIGNLRRKKYKDVFLYTGVILLGAIIPVIAFICIILYWQALPQFYLHTFYWQMIRYPQELTQRLSDISWYVNSMIPLIVTGVLGAVYLSRIAKKQDNTLLGLPLFIYGLIFFTMVPVFPNTFFHYFFYLNPYLTFLSLMCFLQIKSILLKGRNGKIKINLDPNFTFLSIFLTLLILIGFQTANYAYYTTLPYFRQSPYNNLHFYMGNYVSNITNSNDKIWTSEGAIAFFAQRLIEPPNTNNWPLQGFFTEMFGYSFDKFRGYDMKDYKEGTVNTKQFVEAWEKTKVKVIIFIQGNGWIPYPDDLLWDGFRGYEGVANYVQEKYELKLIVTASEAPYVYYVWVRK